MDGSDLPRLLFGGAVAFRQSLKGIPVGQDLVDKRDQVRAAFSPEKPKKYGVNLL
jgi:hypothetical protein